MFLFYYDCIFVLCEDIHMKLLLKLKTAPFKVLSSCIMTLLTPTHEDGLSAN